MRAIILAAGRGSRMGGLTGDRPKCLVELAGRALLDWQVSALRAAGIREIGLVRGYRGEVFEGRVDRLFDNPRWESTNMVASLVCAEAWLRESECIVSYSDIFYAAATVRALAAKAGQIAISYDPGWLELWRRRFVDPLSDAETFRMAVDGRVTEIGRKTASLSDIQGQYMGLLRFSPAGWGRVTQQLDRLAGAERDRLDMTSLLSRLIDAGVPVFAVPVVGGWGEVDSASDLTLYERMLGEGLLQVPVV